MSTFSAPGPDGVSYQADFPNRCPMCHHLAVFNNTIGVTVKQNELQALFQCPNRQCVSYFVAYYELRNNRWEIDDLKPSNLVPVEFSDAIKSISLDFVAIYQEAYVAKEAKLKQIAGPGYRKAFEFLIKDYAKHLAPHEKFEEGVTEAEKQQEIQNRIKKIETSFSGDVVNKYIGDPRIQAVAKRALWLGNDETHYLRKWQQHDINDLVTLIDLTIHWIEIEQQSEKYRVEMPEK